MPIGDHRQSGFPNDFIKMVRSECWLLGKAIHKLTCEGVPKGKHLCQGIHMECWGPPTEMKPHLLHSTKHQISIFYQAHVKKQFQCVLPNITLKNIMFLNLGCWIILLIFWMLTQNWVPLLHKGRQVTLHHFHLSLRVTKYNYEVKA